MNQEIRNKIISYLDELDISYKTISHPAIHTCEDAKRLRPNTRGGACKNIFTRNKKGDEHYLLIADANTKIALKSLKKTLKATALSFASDKRLEKYLRVKAGSVSPLGLIFDESNCINVVIEKKLLDYKYLNFHPNLNTETIELPTSHFLRFIEKKGQKLIIKEFSDN